MNKTKFTIRFLAFMNGIWMFSDGIHVLLTGKYIGTEKPGPWAEIVRTAGVDPLSMGPTFVFFGGFWLMISILLIMDKKIAFACALCFSFANLWYFPIGTLSSLLILVLVYSNRRDFIETNSGK